MALSKYVLGYLFRKIAPEARLIVTTESPSRGLEFYNAGADYVYLPNRLAAQHLLTVVECLLRGGQVIFKEAEMGRLVEGDEVVG